MTLYEVWMKAPQSFVFIREGKTVVEYSGQKRDAGRIVKDLKATSYPMYKSVIEVTLEQ